MKVLQINTIVGTGSTGRIVEDILMMLLDNGAEGCIAASINHSSDTIENKVYHIGNGRWSRGFHALATRFTDRMGFFSATETRKLLKYIEREKFDIVHFHNLHGYYVNLPLLFKGLSKLKVKVVWTFHDCWPLTGHCTYFDFVGCDKWKKQCYNCPQKHKYPKSFCFDQSKRNYLDKKSLFHMIDYTIVTPSYWLCSVCKQSFLADKKIRVIPNGIDLNVFYPREVMELKKQYNLNGKFVIIAVSASWNMQDLEDRKGLKDILELSQMLDESYKLVMIGFGSEKSMRGLPSSILGIRKTNDLNELAKWYSVGDVFINPTKEETLGLVNIEALACGTPVITYSTGGSPETIDDNSGMVVPKGDINKMMEAIKKCKYAGLTQENCVKRAQLYEKSHCYQEYYELYKELLNER